MNVRFHFLLEFTQFSKTDHICVGVNTMSVLVSRVTAVKVCIVFVSLGLLSHHLCCYKC